jgi:hypothetical protein
LREDFVPSEPRGDFIAAPGSAIDGDVGGRWNVASIERVELLDVADNAAKLGGEAVDLRVGER